MLESVYLLLMALAFLFLLLSLWFYREGRKESRELGDAPKIAAPVIFALLSSVLFAITALGSYDIVTTPERIDYTIENSTVPNITTTTYFYETATPQHTESALSLIFWLLMVFDILLAFLYVTPLMKI